MTTARKWSLKEFKERRLAADTEALEGYMESDDDSSGSSGDEEEGEEIW